MFHPSLYRWRADCRRSAGCAGWPGISGLLCKTQKMNSPGFRLGQDSRAVEDDDFAGLEGGGRNPGVAHRLQGALAEDRNIEPVILVDFDRLHEIGRAHV